MSLIKTLIAGVDGFKAVKFIPNGIKAVNCVNMTKIVHQLELMLFILMSNSLFFNLSTFSAVSLKTDRLGLL